jgi:hypothetical protein
MARRPIPFRIRIALAGLAGLGLAWLIPKGGGAPVPMPTPTATDQPGVTAVQVPLSEIPQAVSVREVADFVIYLVRSGDVVIGIQSRSTASEGGRVWWCQRNTRFEAQSGDAVYDRDGIPLFGSAPASLIRVRVLVSADQVTIFPNTTILGPEPPAPGPTPQPPPTRCSASERLG